MMRRTTILALAAAFLAAGAVPSAEAVSRRLDRPGTVSLGGGGSFGYMTGEGRYGLDFETGFGYHVVLRYALARSWALGFYFQNQTYDAIDDLAITEPYDDESLDAPEKMVTTNFEVQLYHYLGQGTDSRYYAQAGLGIYRPELRYPNLIAGLDNAESASFPGEGPFVSAGLGVELFLRENWALDIQGRGLLYFGDGIADQEVEFLEDSGVSVGLHARVGILYFLKR